MMSARKIVLRDRSHERTEAVIITDGESTRVLISGPYGHGLKVDMHAMSGATEEHRAAEIIEYTAGFLMEFAAEIRKGC